jgi:catechol 2,3-dioxygenase-like lactoylglutathione lyase family enzyme
MYSIKTANVTIMTQNMDKSINFYKNIGLTLKQRWENHYAQVEAPGVVIGIHPSNEKRTETNGISIGFGIDSIKDVEDRLKELGVNYENFEDKAGKYVNFRDPDGTLLYFMQSAIEW